MGIKQKLGLGVASAALGLALVGGGTYAYFSDVETNNSSFAAGTLDINVQGNDTANAIIDVGTLKPGDYMYRDFKLNNTGTLDVSKVLLKSSYTVSDAKGDNAAASADFGDHIQVDFIRNIDKRTEVVHSTTLSALSSKDVVDRDLLGWVLGGEADGLKAQSSDNLTVKFTFINNNQDQNVFQGDSIKLKWDFEAKQTAGQNK